MADRKVTLRGNPFTLAGAEVKVGQDAPAERPCNQRPQLYDTDTSERAQVNHVDRPA